MSPYGTSCYKAAIRNAVASKKEQFGRDFSYRKLADVTRVQKTYLSKVLNGEAHLSSDQLYRACRFLSFSQEEREYMTLLHRFARSEVREEKEELKERILAIQAHHKEVASSIDAPKATTTAESMAEYFLEPMTPLIHLLLTIDRYAKAPLLICDVLQIGKPRFMESLATLQRLGLVISEGDHLRVVKDRMHLPKSSHLFAAHRDAMRFLALQKLRNLENDQYESMSISFTANKEVFAVVKEEISRLLKSAQQAVADAPSEECYQLNIDFFRWDSGSTV